LALATLDERERYIFEARRLTDPPLSLAELATRLCVSPERIRQIEVRAFKRVQEAVHAAIGQPNA
jgi:RNA polymerase sigma-32 factor